jgi:hypothetical protein
VDTVLETPKRKKEKNPWKLKYIEMKNVSSISVPLILS